jgi:hypothetical protein
MPRLRLVRRAVFGGSRWFFGFFEAGGAVLVVAAVMGYLARPVELSTCMYCGPTGPTPFAWSEGTLTLLFAGVIFETAGTTGLVLAYLGRGQAEGGSVSADRRWAGFIGGSSGWCMGVALLTIVLIYGPRLSPPLGNGLPSGTYLPLAWGSIVLVALASSVWGFGLTSSSSSQQRRAANSS